MNKTDTITIKDLAAVSGYTSRRLRQLVTESKLPAIEGGELPTTETLRRLFDHVRKDSEELKAERLLKIRAEREIRQIQSQTAAGKFSSRETFDQTLIIFGNAINSAINHQEKPLALVLQAAAPSANPDAIAQAVQKGVDSMRAALAAALENAAAPETEVA